MSSNPHRQQQSRVSRIEDAQIEDAIYDSQAMRELVGINLSHEAVPDAITLLKFRRLLEEHGVTSRLLEDINAHPAERDLLLREGTMVDATIVAAPPSTKNKAPAHDPELHQTKQGNKWPFGLKAHIGADTESGLVHSVHVTSANESDVAHRHELLHGEETEVFADAGYTGVEKRPEIMAAKASGEIVQDVLWYVAAKRGKVKAMPEGPLKELVKRIEYIKAQVRARVEHPFHVVKNFFKHKKTRYRDWPRTPHRCSACSRL